MVIIPAEYYEKKLKVELTAKEIQDIIDELGRVQHDVYTFLNYNKLIEKLKNAIQNKKTTRKRN